MEKHVSIPPWLPLLNALQKDWWESEILKDHNPDPIIEAYLRQAGKWPADRETRH